MPQVLLERETYSADVRAELARSRAPAYLVAAALKMHPCRFSRLVNDDIEPLPKMTARRVLEAIETVAAERRRA
jgi:hypothetical protein